MFDILKTTRASPPSGNAGEGAREASGPYHFHQSGPDEIVYIWSSDKGAIAFTGVIKHRVQTGRTNEENLANAAMIVRALNAAAPPQPAPDAVREAMREACDLLAERKYGNPARSPGHNARLCLESALRLSAPKPSVQTEAPAQSSPCLRYVDAELVCKCVNGKYPEVVDVEWRPPTCKAVASHDGERP